MDQPNYFSIIPASVRYDKTLKPNAKLMYGEITSLTSQEGFCWADNAYFATLYGVDHKTISRWISQLRDGGHIEVEILQTEGNKRRITIDKKVTTSGLKKHDLVIKKSLPSDEKVTPIYENSIINNKTNISSDTAFEFLQKNASQKLESALMKFKSRITDFEKFKTYFNNRADKDNLEYNPRILIGAMNMLAETWIKNQAKDTVRATINSAGAVVSANAPSGQKITFAK